MNRYSFPGIRKPILSDFFPNRSLFSKRSYYTTSQFRMIRFTITVVTKNDRT
ncbi:hypothetical protein LEP1GSC038_3080 [Leptospira weilii str. 2006001855]|uniref:Uncharacterized protein n=1 Tax=Leptospira weilii str. 2006001855 TaxID=996804 RepID=M6FET3_9LEPT|nr:hypothetical protein LEP1GSC051_0545 [Leptospira sp. P2653]EMM71293.1 hypothetical protein LEP1GSC038_3080 [Leptospira weilii str. 2006001855]